MTKNKELIENLREMLDVLIEGTQADIAKLILPSLKLAKRELYIEMVGAKLPLMWKCELPIKYTETLLAIMDKVRETEAFMKVKLKELRELRKQVRAREITDDDEYFVPE